MQKGDLGPQAAAALEEVVGYLNFSSGMSDPKFLASLNSLFRSVVEQNPTGYRAGGGAKGDDNAWQRLAETLSKAVRRRRARGTPLGNTAQAKAVVALVYDEVLPAYLRFHRDLLFHLKPADLFGPLFVGRVFESVLRQGPPWDQSQRIVDGAIGLLNDYLGYRPVAVLRTEQKIEPYPHERVRPIPLYIAGAGVDTGPRHDIIAQTLAILEQTDREMLDQAWFDPGMLDELALDPRAYDFDHPVNKRPNYHFGQWDPHVIDNRGHYRRFVVQHVTFESLMQRPRNPGPLTADELLFEAAAVLAGTILMASGTTGNGPAAHDSTITLSTLLPHIASYRDAFYESLLARLSGKHADRLRAEAQRLKQPFGGARQHLNAQLTRLRATQLEQVHLAQVFAQMGYAEAASRHADIVPVASARMTCRINCRLAAGHLAVETAAERRATHNGEALEHAARQLVEIEDLLHRAIGCGAMIDPWNILGFDGQFSLFPAIENSVHDHRVEQLIGLMQQIFDLYVRLVSEAAAGGHHRLAERLRRDLENLAAWWDKFATLDVSEVESVSGGDAVQSAEHVGAALAAWHQGGASAGDIAFWRDHVAAFNAPKTFTRVVESLFERQDFVASMALLVQWAAQADQIPLEDGGDSFSALIQRWLAQLLASDRDDRLRLALKLFDYLEANAEEYWQAPQLELAGAARSEAHDAAAEDEELDELFEGSPDDSQDPENLFGAAYEDVVYRDSANDGVDGPIFDADSRSTDYELEAESRRIAQRLSFLMTLASLWKIAAMYAARQTALDDALRDALAHWRDRGRENQRQLLNLLRSVQRHAIPASSGELTSMMEYDRRRMIKDALLEDVITACVETADAVRWVSVALGNSAPTEAGELEQAAVATFRAMVDDNKRQVEQSAAVLSAALATKTVLYIPLARGGDPARIVAARIMGRTLHQLAAGLPRLGLLAATGRLMELARAMEIDHPVGPGAVTEFDGLFATGYKAIVECLVESSRAWISPGATDEAYASDGYLIEALQQITEPLLNQWLAHSRTLRLSVLEKVSSDKEWKELVTFCERFGHDLFTQHFLNLGNLRAILHQGVEKWLQAMLEEPPETEIALFDALGQKLSVAEAAAQLGVIIEAVAENYAEYRDYNATTTQSDRGELLYTLLDFLRLKLGYERTNWNLAPVAMAHEVLIRRGRSGAAELWRRALAERTSDIADQLLARLAKLQDRYGMRLPTIADRLSERFVRPLVTDRIVALVRPSMEELRGSEPPVAFGLLEQETSVLTEEPTGVGFDVPDWLMALEEEVALVERSLRHGDQLDEQHLPIEQVRLNYDEAQREIGRMTGE